MTCALVSFPRSVMPDLLRFYFVVHHAIDEGTTCALVLQPACERASESVEG